MNARTALTKEQKALNRRPRIDMPGYEKLPLPYIAGEDRREPAAQDIRRQRACANSRRCSSCGTKIEGDFVFLLDSTLIEYRDGKFHQTGLRVIEPPLHATCAEFSMKVCPHLRAWTKTRQYIVTATRYETFESDSRLAFHFAPYIISVRDAKTGKVLYQKGDQK